MSQGRLKCNVDANFNRASNTTSYGCMCAMIKVRLPLLAHAAYEPWLLA